LHDRDEMRASDTHGTARISSNRLLADSSGRGWHDAYLSLALESPWHATLPAVPHVGLALCLRRSAKIDRRLDGARPEVAQLLPRTLGSIPADRASTWTLDGDPEIELVYLRRDIVDQLAVDEFGADPRAIDIQPRLGFDNALLEQLMLALLDAARSAPDVPSSGLWPDHLVRLVGLELLRSHSNIGRRRTASAATAPVGVGAAPVGAARDYIDAHLGDDLSLAQLARAAGIPSHRLTRAFRDRLGVSPHQYVIHRRLDRAAALLRSSDSPIATVALECGFASQSHLTTAFRLRFGCTPATYRAT
jgi:AraC family transcriptional regulator